MIKLKVVVESHTWNNSRSSIKMLSKPPYTYIQFHSYNLKEVISENLKNKS